MNLTAKNVRGRMPTMREQYVIHVSTIEGMTEICADLVKRRICFDAVEDGTGWKIVCTGGY